MADHKPTNKNQASHLVPVIAVILSMSALVGVFAYSQWPSKNEETVTPIVVHKATNTAGNANTVVNTNVTANTNSTTNTNSVSDVTKDWKAYSNSTYKFSFSYPKGYSTIIPTTTQQQTGYVVSSTGVVSESGTLTALATFKANPVTEAEYPGLTVNVFPLNKYAYNDPPGGSIYVYHATTKNFWVAEGASAIHDAQLKMISGVNATGSITGIGDMGALTNSILFINTDKNQVVELNFSSGAPLDGDTGKATKNVDIWKSIAATFSFTSSTVDWKTYSSKQYGVSFKYPTNWDVEEGALNGPYSVFAHPKAVSEAPSLRFWLDSAYDGMQTPSGAKTTKADATYAQHPAVLSRTITSSGKLLIAHIQFDTTPIGWGSNSTISLFPDNGGSIGIPLQIMETLTIANPTANWKTYTNSTYKFSFKYPSEWTLTEQKTPYGTKTYDQVALTKIITPSCASCSNTLVGMSITSYPLNNETDPVEAFRKSVNIDLSGTTKSAISVAGIAGTLVKGIPAMVSYDAAFIAHSGYSFEFDNPVTSSQILSTFTFTK